MTDPVPAPASGGHRPWSVADAIDELASEADGDTGGPLLRRRIEPERRRSVLRGVFFASDPSWRSSFTVMLLLSAGIAALGLSQNSAATVIGSMIIAPLGAPIAALGGAVAMAWPGESARMLGVVVVAAAGVVGVAVVLGLLLPNAIPNGQILARTAPDLRDLGVAVLAGAAGGYSYTRRELSSSLVGVAIAVALVPPLATAGLMLEERHWVLAKGAATLFAANLVGITISVAVVLLVTGFVPRPRLRRRGATEVAGLGAVLVAVAAVAVPLTVAYRGVMASTQTTTDVARQIAATIGATTTGVTLRSLAVDGSHVTITVSGGTVPAASAFEADLVDELGPGVTVTVRRQP